MNIEPNWERTTTKIDKDVVVTRYGQLSLPEYVVYTGFDPKSFLLALVRKVVPVKQAFIARENEPSITSPLVIDFDKLRTGDYDWNLVALEDLRKA